MVYSAIPLGIQIVNPDFGPEHPADWLFAQSKSRNAFSISSSFLSFLNNEQVTSVVSPKMAMDLRRKFLILTDYNQYESFLQGLSRDGLVFPFHHRTLYNRGRNGLRTNHRSNSRFSASDRGR